MTATAEKSPKKIEPRTATKSQCATAANKRILVVDDDLSIRESLRKVLLAEGYDVALAADDREAVQKFAAEKTDLVLLDLNLPVTSGWDTFGTLTSQDPLLPIIIITGRQNQQELAAAAGISALMVKPLNVAQLLQHIADLLAEDPHMRLKRLVGLTQSLRYTPPMPSKGKPARARSGNHKSN